MGVYLDTQNRVIGRPVTISVGALNTTRTHPREILYPAIKRSALGLVLAHNHPSGSLEPSRDDLEFTRGVSDACGLLGFTLYDHLIVSRRGYVSLKEQGLF